MRLQPYTLISMLETKPDDQPCYIKGSLRDMDTESEMKNTIYTLLFLLAFCTLFYFFAQPHRLEIRKINAGTMKIDCDHNFMIPLAKHLECTGSPLNT